MRALWNGQVLADSKETVEIDGYHYFPRTAVRMDLLRAATKTAGDQQCPHGVQFFDIVDGKTSSARDAWSYEAPATARKCIERWIGFWDRVEVVSK